MQVGDVPGIVNRHKPQFVGPADRLTALYAGACKPHAEAEPLVIAARLADPSLVGVRPKESDRKGLEKLSQAPSG